MHCPKTRAKRALWKDLAMLPDRIMYLGTGEQLFGFEMDVKDLEPIGKAC
jgi:hypothetical protein